MIIINTFKENQTQIHSTQILNVPHMRTIPKALEEIKKIDPCTGLTIQALRRMVATGEIPVINVASKKLINLDLLIEKLYAGCYNNDTIRVL